MAQKIVVEGFRADGPVGSLSELTEVLRKWLPMMTEEEANGLLVRPPFELSRAFSEAEAAAASAELTALGARVKVEEIAVDDPTWWRDRNGDTTMMGSAPAWAAPLPPPPAIQAEPQPLPQSENFWDIWTEVIFRPSAFFASRLVREGGGSPTVFAILLSIIGAVLAVPGNYVLGSAFSNANSSLGGEMIGAVLGTPFVVLFVLLSFAVSLHFTAKVFGGDGDFGVGWRIAAYASAINVFQAVPGVGPLIIVFFYYVYSVAGMQGGYKMTPAKAAAAAVLPIFLILILIVLMVMIIALAVGLTGLKEFMDLMQSNTLKGI
jgi:hypothetical protein